MMTTMAHRIMAAIRSLLHIDRIERNQEQLQRSFDEAREATDRALAKLDELAESSDDPLARFVHGARNASFRRQIKRGEDRQR
jgi:hypothetical protein